MPAGQEIALEPALALVLAEHLHDPPVGRQMIIPRIGLRDPGTIGDLERILPAVRVVLVRTEQPEISRLHVQLHHIAQEPAHDARRFGRNGAGCGHLDSVITEIRQPQFAQQQAAIGVRVGAHAAGASRGKVGQLGPEAAAVVEQLRGSVALHPLFEDAHMGRVLVHLAHRHLVRAPVVLGALAIDFFRARPALGCAKHDHRPARAFRETILDAHPLDALNFADDLVQGGGHQLVHLFRLIPLDEIRRVAIAAEQVIQLLMADAGENAGIGNLVAVEVEDRQNHPVGRRVQELVGMPARCQRSGLRFAVADDTGHDQIGVVEGRSVGMREGVAEFAAFVN